MTLSPVAVMVAKPAVLPSYAAWVRMRRQCEACRYSRQLGQTRLSCSRPTDAPRKGRYAQDAASCINRRDEGQACGPDSVLWEPK